MPWVRLDEDFAEHPKVVTAGPLAMAMHVAGLCYANRNSTDGRIPRPIAKRLIDLDDFTQSWEDVVADLLTAGMWTETEQGFEIHDYLEYQPSKADVEAKRADLHAKRAAAGRKGAEARWDKTPGQNGKHGKPDSKPVASDWQDDGPVPDTDTLDSSPPPTELPAVRWARRWAEETGVPFTAAVRRSWVPKVQDFIRTAGEPSEALLRAAKRRGIESPGGWGFVDPELIAEAERLETHADCEKCGGKGYVEEYASGAGMVKVECQ